MADQDAEGADDVFLCNQAGDAGRCRLPVAPAERDEDPGDRIAKGGEQAVVHIGDRAEAAVFKAVAGQEPDEDGRQQDDGAGLLDEGPAALPHGAQDVPDGGQVVGGQFHDKRGDFPGKHLGLFKHDARDDDRRNPDKVGRRGDPPGAAEQRAGNQRDNRELGRAGDEGGGHDGHPAVPFALNRPGGHDAGDAAAGADQHRDEGLAGEAELAEDAVEDEGDTGHVAAGFEDRQQQEEDQHLRNKAEDRADAGDDAV